MMQRYTIFFLLLFLSPLLTGAQHASLEFVENRGQWDGGFVYKATSKNGDIFLEKNGFTFLLGDERNGEKIHLVKHGGSKTEQLKFHAYRVRLDGAKEISKVRASKEQTHYYNYYYGNDPGKWKSEIHPNLAVDYSNIYDNIDLHISSENGFLKYDFIVKPGGKAEDIQLSFEGVESLSVKSGVLQIKTSIGIVREMPPYAYQYLDGQKKEVACRYKLRDGKVFFIFPDGYDINSPLVIDPVVIFASFSGSTADNFGYTATYDNQGNFYAGGIVHHFSPPTPPGSYPTTPGAFQVTYGGGSDTNGIQYACDIAISKFNPAGTNLIYSTYLGGADNDQPHSMFVDHNNRLVVAGRTYSINFPVTSGCYDNSINGDADLTVTKFNSAGTALIGSTFVGGSGEDAVNGVDTPFKVGVRLKQNYGDDARSEVIVDNQNNVYVAAPSKSIDFPVTGNAFQSNNAGGQDGVVFKLNDNLTALVWSTYIGGSGDDAAYVLAFDTAQRWLYVSGGTQSSNFPVVSGSYLPSYQGGSADGFILKFRNGNTYSLQGGTFIGKGGYDQCFGIQVDGSNSVYAMGNTLGGTFPVSPGVYSNPGSSQFIIKLDSNLNNNIYSTVFGSQNSAQVDISPVAFLVDTCENVYISGWGGLPTPGGGTLNGMPVTPNAFQSTSNGNGFYFFVLSRDGLAQLYGSYLAAPGGNQEHVDGGTSRFDKNGIIYQGICGGCGGLSNFPTTTGVWSPTNQSPNCNFLAVKIAFEFILKAQASVSPDTMGCTPFTIQVSNNSIYGTAYGWDFGDGSPIDTAFNPGAHTYTTPGVYVVKLYVANVTACNATHDTAYLTIVVDSSYIKSDFTYATVDTCTSNKVSFTNTSKYSGKPGAQNWTKFIWNFGDGTSYIGANPPIHNYGAQGTYTVTLIMIDTASCNKMDSVKKTITLNASFVKAGFNADSTCLGSGLLFSNLSVNGQAYSWNFGDGGTSIAHSPVYTYTQPGVYNVVLIVTNPTSCNKTDTARGIVKIKPLPDANFSFDPVFPVANMPIKFTNKSKNAVSYYWGFGDGTGSSEVNPEHLYKKTGTYTVCLAAKNEDGCVDTICKKVDAEIHPAIDVPTGFSPNGDGVNDVLYVRGAAVETVMFKVFNRWGEMVFETKDMKIGWDGTYKGKLQEMEAYAWILDATFIDGSIAHKTGNVTLLR
jgi:gliding motility-associated-like protein